MNDPTGQPMKPSFYDLCLRYQLDYRNLQYTADLARVHLDIVEHMFLDNPVKRQDVEKVLAALKHRILLLLCRTALDVRLHPYQEPPVRAIDSPPDSIPPNSLQKGR
jgi:hypothetical protein